MDCVVRIKIMWGNGVWCCSAGIGRTGCFVAISIGIRQLREEHSVDVLGIVCGMRLDRSVVPSFLHHHYHVCEYFNIVCSAPSLQSIRLLGFIALFICPEVTRIALFICPEVTHIALFICPEVTRIALFICPEVTCIALFICPEEMCIACSSVSLGNAYCPVHLSWGNAYCPVHVLRQCC